MQKNELRAFLGRQSDVVARGLIGCTILYGTGSQAAGGIIVETEAYMPSDPASHTFRGRTKRTEAMFGEPGTIYIYFIYGMHYCMNLVAGNCDGQAVLLRAIEPTAGIELMEQRRRTTSIRQLANGPAKLVQALGVTPDLNNMHMADAGFQLHLPLVNPKVEISPRIGVSKAALVEWNFRLKGSMFTS